MKIVQYNFYLIIVVSVNSQTFVDFSSEQGYVQGPLSDHEDWGGSNWFVYPTEGDEKITTTSGYSWAHWGPKICDECWR